MPSEWEYSEVSERNQSVMKGVIVERAKIFNPIPYFLLSESFFELQVFPHKLFSEEKFNQTGSV